MSKKSIIIILIVSMFSFFFWKSFNVIEDSKPLGEIKSMEFSELAPSFLGLYFRLNQWDDSKAFYKKLNSYRKHIFLDSTYISALSKIRYHSNPYSLHLGNSPSPSFSDLEDDSNYFLTKTCKVYFEIDSTDVTWERLNSCRFHVTENALPLYLENRTIIDGNILEANYQCLDRKTIQLFLNTVKIEKKQRKNVSNTYFLKNKRTDSLDIRLVLSNHKIPDYIGLGRSFYLEIL